MLPIWRHLEPPLFEIYLLQPLFVSEKKTVTIIMRGASVCLLIFTLVSVCAAVDILNVEAVCRTHKHGDVHLKQSALKVYGRVDLYNMTGYFNTTGGRFSWLIYFINLISYCFYAAQNNSHLASKWVLKIIRAWRFWLWQVESFTDSKCSI